MPSCLSIPTYMLMTHGSSHSCDRYFKFIVVSYISRKYEKYLQLQMDVRLRISLNGPFLLENHYNVSGVA